MTSASTPKEYALSSSTNDLRKAIAKVGSTFYDLLEQAMMTADEDDESEFNEFAREALHILARYPDQISPEMVSDEEESNPDDESDEFE